MTQPNTSPAHGSVPFRPSPPRRSGMTLVETVIALLIAVLLIASILTSVMITARQFAEAKAYTNATNIINQQVENLRALPFAQLRTELNVPTDGSRALTPAAALRLHVGPQEFVVTRSSALVRNALPPGGGTPTPNTHLVETTITVAWTILGKPYQTSIRTSFSEFGYAAKS